MPRPQKTSDLTSRRRIRLLQDRMALMRQWMETERAAMEFLDVAGERLRVAKAKVRKRRKKLVSLAEAQKIAAQRHEVCMIRMLTA